VGEETLPQFAILLGAMCYAINALITRKLTHLSKWPMSAALLVAATLLTVPMALYFDSPWNLQAETNSMWAVAALAIGPTAIATWLILYIISRQGASFLSQINFIVPMFGVLFGAIFLSERLPANAWAALVIIQQFVRAQRSGVTACGALLLAPLLLSAKTYLPEETPTPPGRFALMDCQCASASAEYSVPLNACLVPGRERQSGAENCHLLGIRETALNSVQTRCELVDAQPATGQVCNGVAGLFFKVKPAN